jgi:hypothetical protein
MWGPSGEGQGGAYQFGLLDATGSITVNVIDEVALPSGHLPVEIDQQYIAFRGDFADDRVVLPHARDLDFVADGPECRELLRVEGIGHVGQHGLHSRASCNQDHGFEVSAEDPGIRVQRSGLEWVSLIRVVDRHRRIGQLVTRAESLQGKNEEGAVTRQETRDRPNRPVDLPEVSIVTLHLRIESRHHVVQCVVDHENVDVVVLHVDGEIEQTFERRISRHAEVEHLVRAPIGFNGSLRQARIMTRSGDWARMYCGS